MYSHSLAEGGGEMAVIQTWNSGEFGTNIVAELHDNGDVVFSGSGAMKDMANWESPFTWETLNDVTFGGNITYIGTFCIQQAIVNSITIEEGVESLGYRSFYGQRHATNSLAITIPNSVTTLGTYIFQDSPGLKQITFGSGVSLLSTGMFAICSNLDTVIWHSNITTIGVQSFNSCNGFTTFTIPDHITTIDDRAFYATENLATIINQYNGNQTIHSRAFQYAGLTVTGNKEAYSYLNNTNFISAIEIEGYTTYEYTGPPATELEVTTNAATLITPTSAKLNGSILIPEGWWS